MKKLCILLAFLLCAPLLLVGCSNADTSEKETSATTEAPTEKPTEEPTTGKEPEQNNPEGISLDGKKIIFIGDSFVYYGQTVLEKSQSYLKQSDRVNDQGYFYQLCKANGENVSVTNFTFGGHSLNSFCSGKCDTDKVCKGVDHFSYLTDRNYDYVVVSGQRQSTTTAESFLGDIRFIMEMFQAANPNVKFVYLCSSGAHNVSVSPTFPINILNNLKTIEEWGFTIVDWGKLVSDVIKGETSVPGALQSYNKNSFAVCKSASDGYHPNQLAGYITTLMTYCAITGKSAVGQTYDFAETTWRTFSQFKSKYYTYNGATTNYPEIFKSESDMKGLQMLIDRYLEDKAYRDYQFK
ncbi:MAG: hypothetical protein IJX19_01430 [Clostridia bacterium]|nr:hypothetical protein [Clostridia bacterium]